MCIEKDKIVFWRKFTSSIDEREKIERESAKQVANIRGQEKLKMKKAVTVRHGILSYHSSCYGWWVMTYTSNCDQLSSGMLLIMTMKNS